MERKLSDYLHFYMIANVIYTCSHPSKKRGILDVTTYRHVLAYADNPKRDLKLHLRSLSTMTVDELRTLFNETFAPEFAEEIIKKISNSLFELHKRIAQIGSFDTIPRLCAAGFDIFNLINDHLAVDTTKIKT